MLNDTNEMRQARHDLNMLSASDPAVSANVLRHVNAYSLMLTGRRAREQRDGEPQIVGGFVLTHGDHELCGAATRRSGVDTIYIAFDVDDAAGPPVATCIFRKEGDDAIVHGPCGLWSPAGNRRAVLVPIGREGVHDGYFAFRPGRQLKLVNGAVPGDLEAGLRRAATRMQRLLVSDALRHVHREGYTVCLRNEGQELFAEATRAAA